MNRDKFIVRADNVADLISEYGRVSWQLTGLSVLEVLEEQLGPEAMATLTSEQLVHYGYVQGVGHVIMALMAGEARLELTPRPRPARRPKKAARQVRRTQED